MLRTVKISEPEYKAIKALSKKRGQFLTYHLNEAVRFYMKHISQSEEQSQKRQVA